MSVYAVAVSFSASAAQDLMRISPPPGKSLKLLECHVTSEDRAATEMMSISLHRATTNGAGSALTVAALDPGADNFPGSAVYALSSIATKEATLDRRGINLESGYHYVPLKPSRPIVPSDERFVCRLDNDLAQTTLMAVSVVVETHG